MEFIHRYAGIMIAQCPAPMRPDLLDVALEEFVNGCLGWRGPDSGYPLRAYVILRTRSGLSKQIPRVAAQMDRLGRERCVSDMDWLAYRNPHADLDQAIDRWDLQRWADMAELTPMMRWGVSTYAHLGSPRDRGRWADAARAGIRHMRTAALTNVRRDDHWTRTRGRVVR
jgi:hypothetical protein